MENNKVLRKYEIISSDNVGHLNSLVTKAIEHGMELHGSPFVTPDGWLCQAVTDYSIEN